MEHESISASIMRIVFGDLESELFGTRLILERLPEEHFSWKPHEKSMSPGALAPHLVNVLYYQNADERFPS